MITFVSLFLGLVLGPQQVQLAVEGEVAAVELLLDGRSVGRKTAGPWLFDCDLGPRLHPHRLEAVAWNAEGRELDREVQWVNLPRSRAEAAFVLEGDDPQRPSRARLVWKHIEYADAEEIRIRFDGRRLSDDDPGTISLPAYDPEELHVLEADLRFPDGARYQVELAFGARVRFGAEADLTGVAVVSERHNPPSREGLRGAFLKDGEPLQVLGVEKSPGKVILVVDNDAVPALRELAELGSALVAPEIALREGEEVRFVFPDARQTPEAETASKLFPVSQPFSTEEGSIPWVLTRVSPPEASGNRRVTDALAVAGVEAASGSRPRAVVLVLGHTPSDVSAYGVDEVVGFLGELRVPLLVWWVGRPAAVTLSEDRRPLRVETPWGTADDISSISRLTNAVTELREVLDQQLTVWVEGLHLPQQITLSESAKKIRLVGGS